MFQTYDRLSYRIKHWMYFSVVKSVVLCEKVPNVLGRCHTKRRTGARGRAQPPFGMTPTFFRKIRFFFFCEKSVSYQKKGGRVHAGPSFFWYNTDSGH